MVVDVTKIIIAWLQNDILTSNDGKTTITHVWLWCRRKDRHPTLGNGARSASSYIRRMTCLLEHHNIHIQLTKNLEQQIPLVLGYVPAVQARDSESLSLSDRSAWSLERLGLSPCAMSISSAWPVGVF